MARANDPLDATAKAVISSDPELAEWLSRAVGDDLRQLRNTINFLRKTGDQSGAVPTSADALLKYAARLVMRGETPEAERHGYVLAKDECAGIGYDGPAWCPFNLWSSYAFGAHGPNPALAQDCARKLIFSPRADELWRLIAERYERADNIALDLPVRCAEFLDHWVATPKRTPAEHREFRLELQRKAEQLAVEMERFFDRWDYGDDLPPNFTLLLSEAEQAQLVDRVQRHNHEVRNRALQAAGLPGEKFEDYIAATDPSRPLSVFNHSKAAGDTGSLEDLLIMDDRWNPGVVPNLPNLLRRVGQFFADDAELPPLQRPNADNADRNYFVRRLIAYFLSGHGEMSPTIVARITSVFFPQGISDNEVSKQAHYLPDGRRFSRA